MRTAKEWTPKDFRNWRERMGLDQTAAAHRLGCHVNTIGNYERGQTRIPRATVIACKSLEKTPAI